MTATETSPASLIQAVAQQVAAAGASTARRGRDPVNLPMIRNWIEAIGDDSPVYTDPAAAAAAGHAGLVAPPAMIQVWTMPGLHRGRNDDDPLGLMTHALDEAGYTSVVATNCDQVYLRYLRHGEQVSVRASLLDVVGPKRTALGEGWFVTTRSTWYSGDEPVATMDFRVLKFRPQARPAPSGPVLRPQVSPDTAFFWAGTAAGELRIQRCGSCGALRHPPGPMCPHCGVPRRGAARPAAAQREAAQSEPAQRSRGEEPGYLAAAGTGEVYSYVVHHHPPVPGKSLPLVIALVELPEGVRVLADMPGADPAAVHVGMPVRIGFQRIDDELTLPVWQPAGDGNGGLPRPAAPPQAALPQAAPPGETLPELVIEATPTFVISGALATRDFQDVHHDRNLAVARGSKDIFLNILTTTGLVQRFVSGWAGPGAVFTSISIRLGAPCYAGDTLTFSGHVSAQEGNKRVISVTGRCSLGDHVTGTVRVSAGPGERPPGTPRMAGPGERPPGTPRMAGPGERPPGTPRVPGGRQ